MKPTLTRSPSDSPLTLAPSSLVRRYFPRFGFPFLATVALVGGEAACDLVQPTLLARVIDEGIARGRLDLVLLHAGWMLTFALVGAGFALGRNAMSSWVSQAAAARIRLDLYRRIMGRELDEASGDSSDSLLTRLTNDVTQVQNFLNGSMRVFVKAPFLALGAVVMATLLNPGLALFLVALVPVVGALVWVTVGQGLVRFQRVQAGLDRMNATLREFLSGIRVVKAFDRTADEVARFGRSAGTLAEANTDALLVLARVGPLVGLAVNLTLVAVLAVGLHPEPGRAFSAGHLVAFVNYLTQILFALLLAANILNSAVRARASGARISEILDRPGAPSAPATHGVGTGPLGVTLEDVVFRYPGAEGSPVAAGWAGRVAPGEFLGVVGATGAGKSTLAGLVCGFYRPTSGRVLVGGVPIYGAEGTSVRRRIGFVPQRVNLFSGTFRSNLQWGKPGATDAELEAAAEVAGALEFIRRFPEGLDTPVGRGGVTLSGGQKQRLSLARALVPRPDLLILDDSTSAVDAVLEAQILDRLRALEPRPTVLLVAQKLSSVARADRILVLDAGQIAGWGTYPTLAADCLVFQEIHRSQTGVEADPV